MSAFVAVERNRINNEALAAPKLLETTVDRALNDDAAVDDLATFEQKFAMMTNGTFADFGEADWTNVVRWHRRRVLAAGPIMSSSERRCGFLYGTKKRRKLETLFLKLKALPTAVALRTPHTVTVVLPAPKRANRLEPPRRTVRYH